MNTENMQLYTIIAGTSYMSVLIHNNLIPLQNFYERIYIYIYGLHAWVCFHDNHRTKKATLIALEKEKIRDTSSHYYCCLMAQIEAGDYKPI